MYKFINKIIHGDSFKVLKEIPDNSIDTLITDPPYGLSFMGKEWDSFGTDLKKFQEWTRQWAVEALRVAKPGATLLCFGGTRTWHRLACGLEDAGWVIKDTLMWLYGQGFPKATDIKKSGEKSGKNMEKWEGWKSHSLKPAWEPIIMAMKPNEGSYSENALKYGVAGLNIDGGRVKYLSEDDKNTGGRNKPTTSEKTMYGRQSYFESKTKAEHSPAHNQGRFPANVILECVCDEVISGREITSRAVRHNSGGKTFGGDKTKPPIEDLGYTDKSTIHTNPECPCYMLDEQSGERKAGGSINNRPIRFMKGTKDWGKSNWNGYQDIGGASRFFYVAKASRKERSQGLEGYILKSDTPEEIKKEIEKYLISV
jgi:hypothetical protein